MLPANITSEELRKLTNYSAAAIVGFERMGIIERSARDTWPLPSTLAKIVRHLRGKIKQGASAGDARWRAARALEIELRIAERTNQLISLAEAQAALEEITGLYLTELSGLAASVTRDLAIRRAIENEIFSMRKRIADKLERQARSLEERGRAA